MAPGVKTCKTDKCRRYTRLDENGYCPTCVSRQNKLESDSTPYPCGKCGKNCVDVQSCLECELCFEWSHAICLDINADGYKLLKSMPGTRWFCTKCNTKLDTIMEKAITLEADTKLLQTEMNTVKDRLNTLEKKVEGSVHKEIGSALNERTDIERRKMNLVVFNLPEPVQKPGDSAWDTPEKISRDIEEVTKILEEELNIDIGEEEILIDARRIGSKDTQSESAKKGKPRPRPLKIMFSDIKKKREVLSAAKNLRKSNNVVAQRLYINPDLTEAQRKLDKQLRDEMWKRREENNENVIIRRGEIVDAGYEVLKTRKTKSVRPAE